MLDLVLEMSREEFEVAVGEALDLVPQEFLDQLSNLVIVVEDDPPPGDDILGLYEGTPLTERGEWWAAGSLPDKVTIYRNPTLAICETVDDVREEVAITVVHELAHHFGINDARLHELGWD